MISRAARTEPRFSSPAPRPSCLDHFSRPALFSIGSIMKIELRKLSAIRPYPGNPRLNDHAVAAVAASIREFGFRQPIVVDIEGVIIVGHTRWKAAQRLGLDQVPRAYGLRRRASPRTTKPTLTRAPSVMKPSRKAPPRWAAGSSAPSFSVPSRLPAGFLSLAS